MIARTAEFIVKKNKLGEVKDAIEHFVRTVHVTEPGTKIYVSLQEKENIYKFLHVMIFESDGAAQKHEGAVYTKKFTDILYPNCQNEPVFRNYKYLGGL